jgi:hypothetical protein
VLTRFVPARDRPNIEVPLRRVGPILRINHE